LLDFVALTVGADLAFRCVTAKIDRPAPSISRASWSPTQARP